MTTNTPVPNARYVIWPSQPNGDYVLRDTKTSKDYGFVERRSVVEVVALGALDTLGNLFVSHPAGANYFGSPFDRLSGELIPEAEYVE